MDHTGKVTTFPLELDYASNFHDGLARVSSRPLGLWGFINVSGAWVIKPQFGTAPTADQHKRLDRCSKSGMDSNGMFKTTGDTQADAECLNLWGELNDYFFSLEDFSEGLAPIRLASKWGFIDKTGKVVIPAQWQLVNGFANGRALVWTQDGGTQFIDKTGKVVIAGPFNGATSFQEGLAIVLDKGVEHYIDPTGASPFAMPAGSSTPAIFSDGIAAVARTDHFVGYIDRTGAWVVQPWFTAAGQFENGFARVEFSDGKTKFNAVIDATGKPLWLSDGARATFDKWSSWKIGQPAPPAAPTASVDPHSVSPSARTPAGRFIPDPTDKDAVRDTRTGLEWAAHDNGADIDAAGAAAFAAAYRGGGHSDWRLPTADELASLVAVDLAHRERGDCTNSKNYYVLTPLIHVSCGLAWSSTATDAGVTGMGFISGNPRVSKRTETKNYRALVVRDR
jgi:hypothetical protein